MQFNGGNSSISYGNNYDLATASQAFSIVGWVYPTDASKNYQGLLDKQNPLAPFQGWTLLFVSAGAPRLRFQLGDVSGGLLDVVTTTSLTTNSWHFVALTYDGSGLTSGIKIYVDGNVASAFTSTTDTLTGASTSTTQPLRQGWSESNGSFFVGNQNQWSMHFGTALNTTQIGLIYGSGLPSNLFSLPNLGRTSYWYLNQVDSTTLIADRQGTITGIGSNLTLVNSVP